MAEKICFHDNKPGNCPQIRGNSAPLFLHPGALPQRRPFFTPILPQVALMFNHFVVQESGPMLTPAGVHLEVRILAELLDADKDAPDALRLALFSAAVISPLPGRGNRRLQFIP
jgi:hypothetical protein